jgi:hypothetical protein
MSGKCEPNINVRLFNGLEFNYLCTTMRMYLSLLCYGWLPVLYKNFIRLIIDIFVTWIFGMTLVLFRCEFCLEIRLLHRHVLALGNMPVFPKFYVNTSDVLYRSYVIASLLLATSGRVSWCHIWKQADSRLTVVLKTHLWQSCIVDTNQYTKDC